ncbi:hypothetical protein BKA70DRAFT_830460 [Coprinopsis sp. MPI-PUGE-AT-0042]|nr:hypothetical protein BKA70DRAFT_830460 [Coprinopsis sp. MPI-PUGE-AT-0042]
MRQQLVLGLKFVGGSGALGASIHRYAVLSDSAAQLTPHLACIQPVVMNRLFRRPKECLLHRRIADLDFTFLV